MTATHGRNLRRRLTNLYSMASVQWLRGVHHTCFEIVDAGIPCPASLFVKQLPVITLGMSRGYLSFVADSSDLTSKNMRVNRFGLDHFKCGVTFLTQEANRGRMHSAPRIYLITGLWKLSIWQELE